MTKPGENPESDVTRAQATIVSTELKRLRRAGLADLALRPQRYPALRAVLTRPGEQAPTDVLACLDFNLRRFRAAVDRLPTEPMRRAATILFHVGRPGTLPPLEARRRAADCVYTGKPYPREPDTIQRHLERDVLDPLLTEALQCLRRPVSATRQAWEGDGRDGNEAPEDDLECAISGLGRRDFSGAAVALAAWLARSRHDYHRAGLHADASSNDAEIDRMNRRALLRRLGLAGTLAVLPPPVQEATKGLPGWLSTRRTSKIDGSALDDLCEINSRLWQVFAASESKRDVFALARHQVDILVDALEDHPNESVHKRLCTLLSDVLQLAGEVFFDREHYVDAAQCYTIAASVSKEAGAHDLWSCSITRHAFIGVYERRFSDAIPMLEAAARLAVRGDNQLSTRHSVDAVAAQAYAGLRNVGACEQAMTAAAAVQGMRGEIHNGGWLRFDGSRLNEERGACYVELGRPDEAQQPLQAALQDRLSDRRKGSVLVDLAIVGAYQQDADRVTSFGHEALGIARRTGSGVVGRRLQALQTRLGPMLTNTQVRQLYDEISALRARS